MAKELEQISFLDDLYERYQIKKPIRLIELFAGYGSQKLAMEHLGIKHESFKICEWNAYSMLAYKYLHSTDTKDYSSEMTKDQIVNKLFELNVSLDWNKPAEKKQLMNRNEKFLRDVYNAIISTHNLVDISRAKGKDFEMRERERWCVVLTYSFPCQDLSLAGNTKGMEKGSNTRSSLLWQVERILLELKEINQLPDILLMENVPQVIGEKNIHNFIMWQDTLNSLGYESYTKILNASDYGIPQHRERAFCLSILNAHDKTYTFPKTIKLTKVLYDMLEDNVDEKYFMTEKQIEAFKYWNAFKKPLEDMEVERERGILGTLTTRSGENCSSIKLIKTIGNYSPSGHNATRVVGGDGVAPTVMMNHCSPTGVVVRNENKKRN